MNMGLNGVTAYYDRAIEKFIDVNTGLPVDANLVTNTIPKPWLPPTILGIQTTLVIVGVGVLVVWYFGQKK